MLNHERSIRVVTPANWWPTAPGPAPDDALHPILTAAYPEAHYADFGMRELSAAPAPTTLSAAGIAPGTIALAWRKNPPGVTTHFLIYRGTAADFRPGPLSLIGVTSAENAYFLDKGRTPGLRYYYRVTAAAADGLESAPSAVASAVANDEVTDVDQDGTPDPIDADDDNDGILDGDDPDIDGDTVVNAEDPDTARPDPAAAAGPADGAVTIDFDDLDIDTAVTNQYPTATFSGGAFKVLLDWSPKVIGVKPDFNANLTVDFALPVNGLRFDNGWQDGTGKIAEVRVFVLGQLAATVPLIGAGQPGQAVHGTMDLSGFNDVTRIAIVNLTDDQGLAYDNFTFRPQGVDLDVDSDNNDGAGEPQGTTAEEELENGPGVTGKVISVNDGDGDGDGLVDYRDGFDADNTPDTADNVPPSAAQGDPTVPILVKLAKSIDLSKAKITLAYLASVPGQTSPGISEFLRLWRKSGAVTRNPVNARGGGDFVEDGTGSTAGYTPSELGADGRTIKLWVEAVKRTVFEGDGLISVAIDPDGSGPIGFIKTDCVIVRAVKVDLDVDHDGKLTGPHDGATKYRSGCGPPSPGDLYYTYPLVSTGSTFSSTTYVGQEMALRAEGLGTDAGVDAVTFEIVDSSNFNGYAENATDAKVEGLDREDDFSFEELSNPIPGTVNEKAATLTYTAAS